MAFRPKGVELLFVYGTLKRRFEASVPMAAYLAERSELVGEGSIAGDLYNLGRYPGLVLCERQFRRVHGEVVQITQDAADVLRKIDEYEDCAPDNGPEGLYSRADVPVRLKNGAFLTAWTYVYNASVDDATRLPDGVWRGV